jgi:acetyl esterase
MDKAKRKEFYRNPDGSGPVAEVQAFLESIAPDWAPAAAGGGRPADAGQGSGSRPRPSPARLRKENSIMAWADMRDGTALVSEHSLPTATGRTTLRLRSYRPRHSDKGSLPVLLYFHGGGFVFGSVEEADPICAALAVRTPCLVVSVDYRLAPEQPFPAALEDARAALAWLGAAAPSLGGDPDRIIVAGESAGAGLAARLCQEARAGSLPHPAAQLLLCPWLDLADFDRGSHRQFGHGPWLSLESLGLYRDWYLGAGDSAGEAIGAGPARGCGPGAATDPRVSPLREADLVGLPPALVLTAGFDPLRDEGAEYASRLVEAGVTTTRLHYEGMIHSFFVLGAAIETGWTAIDACAAWLRTITQGGDE